MHHICTLIAHSLSHITTCFIFLLNKTEKLDTLLSRLLASNQNFHMNCGIDFLLSMKVTFCVFFTPSQVSSCGQTAKGGGGAYRVLR